MATALDNSHISQRTLQRQKLRRLRRKLTPQQQQIAASNIYKIISRNGVLKRGRRIALYWANDGEVDPQVVLKKAHQRGYRCYLPTLVSGYRLQFAAYNPGDGLTKNRFGIAEPCRPHLIAKLWTIATIFMPLVGFDRHGRRLGMGGGFYDRTLALGNTDQLIRQPTLIGLAHACQEVHQLETESWDVPLSKIVTDKEQIVCEQSI